MIKLSNGYVITADPACYTLNKTGTTTSKKTGEKKECLNQLSYHSTVENALKSLVGREQRKAVVDKDMSLSEAISEFKSIREHWERELKEALANEMV